MNNKEGTKRDLTLLFIVLFAFFIRASLAFSVYQKHHNTKLFHYYTDTESYLKPAEFLLSRGDFSTNGVPDVVRTPGYPIFLIPGILMKNVELISVFLQIILSCLTVLLVYKLCLIVVGNRTVALIASILFALDPLSIIYSNKLVSEIPFVLLTTIALISFVKIAQSEPIKNALIAGVFFALAVYVRPIGYYLPFLLVVLLIFQGIINKNKLTPILISAVVFIGFFYGITVIWQIRNKQAANYPGFSAITDLNLYYYQGASILSVIHDTPFYEMQKELGFGDTGKYFQLHPEQVGWEQADIFRYMRKFGMQLIYEHPFVYSGIHFIGIGKTLLDPGAITLLKMLDVYHEPGGIFAILLDRGLSKSLSLLIEVFQRDRLVFWAHILLGVILFGYLTTAIIGWLSSFKKNGFAFLILSGAVIYFLVVSGGPTGTDRFRLPLIPVICIFSAVGLQEIYQRVTQNKNWSEISSRVFPKRRLKHG